MRRIDPSDADCAIAQASAVVGDWWTLLLVRDIVGGTHRFDQLQAELSVSRKVLTERLGELLDAGVLEKRPYSEHPPRFEYHLTPKGHGLVPVLVALQNWGTQHVLGDGTLTATGEPDSAEAHRVRSLVGTHIPDLTLTAASGASTDPVSSRRWTVLYFFPGAFAPAPGAYPPGWELIPGARGCTLESMTYRDRIEEFLTHDAQVYGVSTQRPDELAAFTDHATIPFPLLSDQPLELAAALRLPTFRAGGIDRLKRLTLLVRDDRRIEHAFYPVPDPAGSVQDALTALATSASSASHNDADDPNPPSM